MEKENCAPQSCQKYYHSSKQKLSFLHKRNKTIDNRAGGTPHFSSTCHKPALDLCIVQIDEECKKKATVLPNLLHKLPCYKDHINTALLSPNTTLRIRQHTLSNNLQFFLKNSIRQLPLFGHKPFPQALLNRPNKTLWRTEPPNTNIS